MSFVVLDEVVLASAVADDGTVTLSYPSGYVQANFTGVNASATGVVVRNHNEVYLEDDPGIDLSYGASNVTLTNQTGVAWAAGDTLRVQFGIAGNDRPGFQAGDAITKLTDSSGGTASTTLAAIGGTYSQSEVRNSVATLAAQIERLRLAMVNNGIISA